MILRKEHKRAVEKIAKRNWESAAKQSEWSPNQRYHYARRWTEEDIIVQRHAFGRDGFGSVMTSILVSLAIKFATQLLLRWLENELK